MGTQKASCLSEPLSLVSKEAECRTIWEGDSGSLGGGSMGQRQRKEGRGLEPCTLPGVLVLHSECARALHVIVTLLQLTGQPALRCSRCPVGASVPGLMSKCTFGCCRLGWACRSHGSQGARLRSWLLDRTWNSWAGEAPCNTPGAQTPRTHGWWKVVLSCLGPASRMPVCVCACVPVCVCVSLLSFFLIPSL